MGLQMKGGEDSGCVLCSPDQPLPFGSPASKPPLTPVPLFPTILPTDLSFQQTHPHACSWGASVLPVPTASPPRRPGSLSQSRLPAGSWNALQGLAQERPARPEPSSRCGGSDPRPGGGHPPGSNPTMHCTSERAATGHQGHRALRPRTAGHSTAHRKTRPGCRRRHPSGLTLSVSREEPAV